jgi:hypothetical protein
MWKTKARKYLETIKEIKGKQEEQKEILMELQIFKVGSFTLE